MGLKTMGFEIKQNKNMINDENEKSIFPKINIETKMCDRPWLESYVLSNGDVLCHCLMHSVYDECGKRIMSMGNLNDYKNFEDLWLDKKYIEIRKNFINRNITNRCKNCVASYSVNFNQNNSLDPSNLLSILPEKPKMPKFIMLEVTTNCCYLCPPCYRQCDPINTKTRGHISIEIVDKVVDSINDDVEKINLSGQGESLSNINFFDISKKIRYKSKKIETDVTTTMWYVDDEEKMYNLATCGLTRIEISLFATNNEEFKRYYGIDGFDKVFKNIKNFINIFNNLKKSDFINGTSPKIIWKYILFKWNDSNESIDFLYRESKNMGVPIMFTTTSNPPDGCSIKFKHNSLELNNLRLKFGRSEYLFACVQ